MNENRPQAPIERIETGTCVFGYFATEPELTRTEAGVPKFYARYRIPRHRREADGSVTRLEPDFRSMVAYWETAELAYEKFRKGDAFIAQGQVRVNSRTGKERFAAKRIGHNPADTPYEVDRSARPSAATAERAVLAPAASSASAVESESLSR